jgi:hypothetical protein
MVGLGRVELPTSPLSGVRSSQLSYRPGQRAGPSKLDGTPRAILPHARHLDHSRWTSTPRPEGGRTIDLVVTRPRGPATP